MKRFAGLIAVLLAAPSFASVGQQGAAFLDIPVGAEPAALGSAYSAVATNAYAPTWNAGALGFVDSTELAGQHLSYLQSIHDEFASFVFPLDKSHSDANSNFGTLGFAVQYLGSGDINGMDDGAHPTGTFSSHYAAYNLSYGKTLTSHLALGLTGKWINAALDDVNANAYAVDMGALYKATDNLNVSATMTNLGSKLKFIDQADSLPLAFRIGAAYKPEKRFLITVDGDYRKTEGMTSGHVGVQWQPIDLLSLRAGYRTDTLKGLDAIAGVSAGIGLNLWEQEFSYAWVPYGDLGNTQYFSLLLKFGAREEAKRNLIRYQTIKSHRTVKAGDNQSEPEYQQLMQLLDDNQEHLASRRADKGQNQ